MTGHLPKKRRPTSNTPPPTAWDRDVIDINNDEHLRMWCEMDMDPEDNYRKKMLMPGYNYQNYLNNDSFGYQYQYVRKYTSS